MVISFSCKEKRNEQAIQYLETIQNLYENGEYTDALEKIDSIQVLYPKAFPEIKTGLALKQDVRRALNQKQVSDCDSLLSTYQAKTDSLKKFFIYRKDKEDVTGVFIPKTVSAEAITSTMLRAGVNEGGSMYIESVYTGGQLHNTIQVATKDKQHAESLPINDDGFNFRFSHSGKQYEIIKVTTIHDNGLAKFIYNNADKPLTVTLKGKNTLSYTLANVQKKAITDSYALSSSILIQDSLNFVKNKALDLIKYLDSEKSNKEKS